MAEHRLLVGDLEVVVPAERAGSAAVTPRSTSPKDRPKVAVAAPGPNDETLQIRAVPRSTGPVLSGCSATE